MSGWGSERRAIVSPYARWSGVFVAAAFVAGATLAIAGPGSFDGKRAHADLARQCAFGPRVPGTEAHKQCDAWLTQVLSACADSVETQRFTAEVGGREVWAQGEEVDYEPVLASMCRRDEIDSGREVAPLRVAGDAVVLDTTDLSIEEVLAEVERLVGWGEGVGD